MIFKPFCSTDIRFTDKEGLKQGLLKLTTRNILLIMSKSSAKRWDLVSFIDSLKDKCKASSTVFIWIETISANPTQLDIKHALAKIKDSQIDVIIAVGGGSAIDLAKGISAFHDKKKNALYTSENLTNEIKSKGYKDKDKFIDIIAVPTTAGTGSEVTQWATIWDEERSAKFSIDDPRLQPKQAVIVPELTATLPAKMTLATGLDAMSQAIESYWSKHTTPIVQELAIRSTELIIRYLRKAVEEPQDIKVREKLCRASVLAGLSFAQTRTTACHSISYPLTMLYDVPHGLAASITLDAVANKNRGSFPNDLELFSLFDGFGGIKAFINEVCKGAIDMRLSSFGIREKDIDRITDNAFTGGRMDNNPVDLSKEDVKEILLSVL